MSSTFDIASEEPSRSVAARPEPEGFWAAYKRSLKPLEVEEPIDVWIHRPLAYLLAKALMPTPVSPNAVTVISILFGIAGGIALLSSFPHHMLVGGLCIFASAVFDCADGQLARMRGTSSLLGRMLDGSADLIVSVVAVGGGTYVVWSKFNDTPWMGALALLLCVLTAVTGSFHTGMYDHYKNVFLRLTNAKYQEAEDYETALARFRERQDAPLFVRLAWYPYLFYVKSQEDYSRRFDPYTSASFSRFPAFDEERARIYRRHAEAPMRLFRAAFGFGSLVFGIALFCALDLLEWYMLVRLVLQNAVFYGYLRPLQRRASREAFREMGFSLSAPVHAT